MSSSASAEAEMKRRQNWLRLGYLCLWWSYTSHIAKPRLENWPVLSPLSPDPLFFSFAFVLSGFCCCCWWWFCFFVVFLENFKKDHPGV